MACPHVADPPARLTYRLAGAMAGSKKICRLCGCNVRIKGRLPHERCPDRDPVNPGTSAAGESRYRHLSAGRVNHDRNILWIGSSDPQKSSIDTACHDLGKEAGKWIMYQVGGKTCYCICSCLGEGALVATGDNRQIPVEDIVANSTMVLAAGKSLDFKPTVVGQIVGTARRRDR